MMKRLILSFFLLLSLSLQAQTEKRDSLMNDNIEADSLTSVRPSAFKRAIKKFMNFSDFDTLYISPNRYNYALMATHFSNFEYYSVSSDLPQPQKLSFSPNPHNKIGLYFGWRWIFLGWSVDVDDIYRKTNRKNKGTEFDLSLYSSKLGVDIFYRRTGNNYKIHKIRGFYDEIPSNYQLIRYVLPKFTFSLCVYIIYLITGSFPIRLLLASQPTSVVMQVHSLQVFLFQSTTLILIMKNYPSIFKKR